MSKEMEARLIAAHNDLDCDVLADAIRGCAANMIERMREDYHRFDPRYADEAVTFIRDQLGDDADAIIADAIAKLEAPGGCGAARLAIIWTARSSNKKTGPMPVSTTSKETCAPVCPFKGNGCYAESGPLAALWAKLTETGPGGVFQSGVAKVRTIDWRGLCANVAALAAGTVWRHNQAGDLPHKGGKIDQTLVLQIVRANRGRRGFTYTHHNVLQDKANAELVAWSNRQGFTINLSGNNPAHADQLAELAIAPVVTVLPEDAPRNGRTPAGRPIVVCPATYREDVACITCQLCARQRDVIVGFPAHGARRRKAAEVVEKGA